MDENALRISGETGARLSVSSTAASSSVLKSGTYKVFATCNCYIKIGSGTVTDVTTSTGDILYLGNTEFYTVNDKDKFGVITSGADTGTFGYIYVTAGPH